MAYDYIIIGSGAGAGPLILRLSENPNTRILVLEAGPDLPTASDRRKQFNQYLWDYYQYFDWKYRAEPSPLGGPPIFLPRGKLVGGTTHLATGFWLRASPGDHAEWDQLLGGNSGWSFNDALPFYNRVESDLQYGNTSYHGSSGPIPVYRVSPNLWPTVDLAFSESAQQNLGIPFVGDHNSPDFLGTPLISPAISNRSEVGSDGIRRGCRQCGLCNVTPCKYDAKQSTLVSYLAQARVRSNVEIRGSALVDKIIFNSKNEAVAVDYLNSIGQTIRIDGSQVLLCAGSYGSPAILMRSGMGPADHLQEIGISTLINLPGVGHGLQDHPGLFLGYLLKEEFAPHISFNAVLLTCLKSGVIRSTGVAETETDLHLITGHYMNLNLFPVIAGVTSYGLNAKRLTQTLWRRLFGYLVALTKPRSEGKVKLRSKDPTAKLKIDLGFFSNTVDQDLQILWTGYQKIHQIFSSSPIQPLLDTPLPGPKTAQEVPFYVDTYSHPTRTCRMGLDSHPYAVCDRRGRVRGVSGLRVVDASLMPTIPRANVNLPTLMIGERVADFILNNTP